MQTVDNGLGNDVMGTLCNLRSWCITIQRSNLKKKFCRDRSISLEEDRYNWIIIFNQEDDNDNIKALFLSLVSFLPN